MRKPECRHEHRCSQRNHGAPSRRRVCSTRQLEGSDLLGKTCKHGRASRYSTGADLKCSRHSCAKHGSAGQCAWQACLPPPTQPWVSLARLKASPGANSRGVTQVKERLRPGKRRMQRLSGQRPSGSSFERSRRSSSAAATRLVADVLELIADVVLACQCLRSDT